MIWAIIITLVVIAAGIWLARARRTSFIVVWGSERKRTLKFREFSSRSAARPFVHKLSRFGHEPRMDYLVRAGVLELDQKATRA